MKVHGRCHCGAITYEADVQPGTVAICHCLDCQKQTGSVFRTNIPAPAAGFRILTGQPRLYVKVADSGTKRVRAFCGNCAGPIYASAAESPQFFSLRIGALDEKETLGPPVRQIWTKRRLSSIPKLDGVKEFDGQP
jgi:hypothetical protein